MERSNIFREKPDANKRQPCYSKGYGTKLANPAVSQIDKQTKHRKANGKKPAGVQPKVEKWSSNA